jgi:hypothetical protein
MNRIEDVVYEAYTLGLRDQVFDEVSKLKNIKEYKYVRLYDIYEMALNKVKSELHSREFFKNKIIY